MTKKQKELFEAVGKGNLEEVRKLLAVGTDPNVKGKRKTMFAFRTLMEGAVQFRARLCQTIQNLLPSEQKDVPRIQSEAATYLEIVKELIRAGAQLNPRTSWESPLYIAAAAGDLEVVVLLLAAGTDPNGSLEAFLGRYNEMALHAAACGGYGEIVQALLKAGADRTMQNWRGKTPLEALHERKRSTEIETWERMSNPSEEVKQLLAAKYEDWSNQRTKIEQLLEAV